MSYRVEKENGRYLIIEKGTDLKVREVRSSKEARDLCRSLNLGSGFDGFTPLFFTQEYKQTEKAPT